MLFTVIVLGGCAYAGYRLRLAGKSKGWWIGAPLAAFVILTPASSLKTTAQSEAEVEAQYGPIEERYARAVVRCAQGSTTMCWSARENFHYADNWSQACTDMIDRLDEVKRLRNLPDKGQACLNSSPEMIEAVKLANTNSG